MVSAKIERVSDGNRPECVTFGERSVVTLRQPVILSQQQPASLQPFAARHL
jgi:hypothetical protein